MTDKTLFARFSWRISQRSSVLFVFLQLFFILLKQLRVLVDRILMDVWIDFIKSLVDACHFDELRVGVDQPSEPHCHIEGVKS